MKARFTCREAAALQEEHKLQHPKRVSRPVQRPAQKPAPKIVRHGSAKPIIRPPTRPKR